MTCLLRACADFHLRMSFDSTHHLLCNKLSGSRSFRHDSVVQVLMTWARRAGTTVTHEPQHLFADSNRRADLLVVLGPHRFYVVITHPASPSYLAGNMATDTSALVAAKSRDSVKIASYRRLTPRSAATFIPFACETCGALGPAAQTFAKKIATHAAQYTN